MRLLCVGISYHDAPLEIRGRLAFDTERLVSALDDLTHLWPGSEFLLLSTCNRTELYAAREIHGHPRKEALLEWLGQRGELSADQRNSLLVARVDAAAAGHFFAVAAGLDSMIPGEAQIVSQIKAAADASDRHGVLGPALRSAVDEALHVAKHVRSETGIAEGNASVASLAVEVIRRRLGDLSGRVLLAVGSGKNNTLLLRRATSLRPDQIMVTNRNPQRGQQLADAFGARFEPLDQLPSLLADADVVVTSTTSRKALIPASMLEPVLKARADRPMLLLDLSVPRDVAPEVEDLPGAAVVDLDGLEADAQDARERRREHFREARQIIDAHVGPFLSTLRIRQVAPTLEALYRRIDGIVEQELADARNKLSTHDDTEADMEILRRSLRRAMRTFLHPAAEHLRNEAADAGGLHAAMLHRVFGLEEQPPDDSDT